MIGHGRHKQGRVSGIILANVCVISSPSGPAFYVVPEGVDGPLFCQRMVERYAKAVAPRQAAPERKRFAGISIHFCRKTFDLTITVIRRKRGAQ